MGSTKMRYSTKLILLAAFLQSAYASLARRLACEGCCTRVGAQARKRKGQTTNQAELHKEATDRVVVQLWDLYNQVKPTGADYMSKFYQQSGFCNEAFVRVWLSKHVPG